LFEGFKPLICATANESNSKLIVAWHLGRRTEDTLIFLDKLYNATDKSSNFTANRIQKKSDIWRLTVSVLKGALFAAIQIWTKFPQATLKEVIFQ